LLGESDSGVGGGASDGERGGGGVGDGADGGLMETMVVAVVPGVKLGLGAIGGSGGDKKLQV
jgi:hypothetical protein